MESQSPEQVDVVSSTQEEEKEKTENIKPEDYCKTFPEETISIRCQTCHKTETLTVPVMPVTDLEPFVHYAIAIEKKGWSFYFEKRAYNALFARVYYRCSTCRLSSLS